MAAAIERPVAKHPGSRDASESRFAIVEMLSQNGFIGFCKRLGPAAQSLIATWNTKSR